MRFRRSIIQASLQRPLDPRVNSLALGGPSASAALSAFRQLRGTAEHIGVAAMIFKTMKLPILLVALPLIVASATVTSARDYGQYRDVDPAIREWIQGLKDKEGHGCCETADGHPAEYEWDVVGNRYKVRIEGQWYDVPAEAVVDGPNKLGYATVWYWWSWELDGQKAYHVRCFLPGPGG